MRKILFNDITLRDGEQSPGVNFFPEEKLEIARQLVRMGLPIIEAGFAVASDSDWKGVNLIARELGGQPGAPVICSMARAHHKDIDAAHQALRPALRPRIQVVLATSDLHLEHKLKISREECLARTRESVAHARSLVEDVEFAAEDATRSDPAFLFQVFAAALEAGARTLEIPDTVGYAAPHEYGALVKAVLDNVPGAKDAVIATHCHDDLGLATANTLAGIAAGAGQAECTINGIGERAGNAPFEEVVMALKTRPGQWGAEADIDTRHIVETSRLVERLAGMAVAPNKAIVGGNAFRHESGIHQHGMLCNALTYQIISPESVGAGAFRLDLGKLSGRHALMTKAQSLGVTLDDQTFEAFHEAFKDLAAKKKMIVDDDVANLLKRFAPARA
ncbi:MAG: 2-isopropylmalate synthase [Alphaproteobacteria bacterium]|nr:2-isopropylmalate synthase [Alphaproteobacteria bacterium]